MRRYLETGLEINSYHPQVCQFVQLLLLFAGCMARDQDFALVKILGVDELQSDMNILAYTN